MTALVLGRARANRLLDLAEAADAAHYGPAYASYRTRLERHADAFEPAVRCFLDIGEPDAALRLVAALRAFWQERGTADLGRALTDLALDATGPGRPARPAALLAAAELAFRQADREAAARLSSESVALARRLGDRRTAGLALLNLARVALRDGDATSVVRLARRAQRVAPGDAIVRRGSMHLRAWAAHAAGDLPGAIRRFTASLALRRRMGDEVGVAVELGNLADMALEQGDPEAALGHLRESLVLARRLDARNLLLAGLISAAKLAARRGDAAAARPLLDAARAGYRAAGLTPDMADEDLDQILAGSAARRRPAMSVDDAVAEVLAWGTAG